MNGAEERAGSVAAQKQRIRERYKGIDADLLEVIPAIPPEDIFHGIEKKRVGVYARVSTDDPRQTSSYELQKNHYEDVVSRNPNWELVKIYADEGISGTSLQHRDAFIEMIADCKAHKLDMIITKTVARFARNVIDCIGYARELAAQNPPIGILFETENIYTLNSNSEMSLSFIATLAQEESHTKSEIMNASIEMRFRRGIFLTPPLLGYDNDDNGNLVINEEEAKTVRLIFFMYLYGFSTQKIAETLTELGRLTKLGNKKWSSSSILQILQNERYCGDVLARKTFTPNYLNHKSKKNRKDRNQYYHKNHHDAIISRDDFLAVQQMIYNAKYGNRGILPQLHVIEQGALQGYVPVNPRWSGFKAKDYQTASGSIYTDSPPTVDATLNVEVNTGDFDLRGYEVARGQYFSGSGRVTASFNIHDLKFSTECVRKFPDCTHVEMLVHPGKKMFSVRPAPKEARNSVQWAKVHDGVSIPRPISGTAFLPTLYALFDWNPAFKYRVTGCLQKKESESVLIFNTHDTEVFISATAISETESTSDTLSDSISPFTAGAKKDIVAFPADWATNFGESYYAQSFSPELSEFTNAPDWQSQSQGTPFKREDDLNVSSPSEIKENIDEIINDLRKEEQNE
ncbi:MAG: recombinase family protein [Lachnospiraceae bacterium]|nr:recombinase family protein [Lachnospiraceae bacterium]